MQKITSQEILEATGIKSVKTLTRWHQRGLIPEPTIGTHPNGRGKIAYWEKWVLARCIQIRSLADQGFGLAEIEKRLPRDWKAEARRFARRYRLQDASREIDYQTAVSNLILLVDQQFMGFVTNPENGYASSPPKTLRQMEKLLSNDDVVASIIDHVCGGRHPLLVFDGDKFAVVPDFVAAQILAEASEFGGSFVITSLYEPARKAFAKIIPDLPPMPTVWPARCLESEESGRREFRRVGESHFEVVSPTTAPRNRRRKSARKKK